MSIFLKSKSVWIFQKDRELCDISSQLMFLQGQLKHEQSEIQAEIEAKNQTIAEQQETIARLSAENKKLVDILVVSKNKAHFQMLKDEQLQRSLENLTRSDSGLGFPNKSSSGDQSKDFIEFQKAFDSIRKKHNNMNSVTSNATTDTSDFLSDANITQEDVFREDSYDKEVSNSFPDIVLNTTTKVESTDINMDLHNKGNSGETTDTTLYANPKLIIRRKKTKPQLSDSKSTKFEPQFRSRHMSIDLDKAFDNVGVTSNHHEFGPDEKHWYSEDDDDEKSPMNTQNHNNPVKESRTTHSLDRKQSNGSSFFRDMFNTLRHKTVRIKRRRSKSLSVDSKRQVIFLAQTEPDTTISKEVSIDEAIAKRRKTKVNR